MSCQDGSHGNCDAPGLAVSEARRSTSIRTIETFQVPPRWLFVRIETADGLVGWGEASLEGHSEAVDGAYAAIRDRFIGADSEAIEDIWQTAYRLGFYRGGPVLMSALSGLDQALWDIKGKRLGVPVWQLLGGKVRDRIAVYSWIGGDDPQAASDQALQRRDQGFNAVKMNATGRLGRLESASSLAGSVDRVAEVRSLGIDVAVDFHGRVHKPMAKQLARALEPLSPLFIEEPLLSEQPEAIADFARRTSLPVATGERLYSRWDFRPLFEAAAIDVAQPDLSHAGGISECRRISAMAEAYDVAIAPHCPLGPIALAACIQLDAAVPNFAVQEMSLGIHYNSDTHDLLTYLRNPEILAVSDGTIAVPESAGLGIDVDEDRVRHAAGTGKPWRNPVWRGPDGSLREW